MSQIQTTKVFSGKIEEQVKSVVNIISSDSLVNDICKVMIKMGRPSDKWSLGNKLLALVSGTNDARGYRQWQEVGRYVKKGSRAVYILAPNTTVIRKDKDGKELEKPKVIITGFRGIPVFRVEDTEGKEINHKPQEKAPLLEVATKWGIKVSYEDTHERYYGAFDPVERRIILGTEDISTFFHELSHVAHERIDGKLKVTQDPEQETIAQLSACVLARMYGYKCEGYTQAYIRGYTEEKTNIAVAKMAMRVLHKVQQVVEMIIYTKELEA